MTRTDSTDKFARWVAVISLVVAIASVAVPYVEQRSQFQVMQREELSIQLNPYTDGPIRVTNDNFGPMGRVVQIPWQVTLSNTGNQKLSITNYSIRSGDSPNSTYYTGIDGGMLGSDLKPVALPISLDPGESRIYLLMIGILVPPNVNKILSSIGDPKARTMHHVEKVLAMNGIDIFGHKVTYQTSSGGGYSIRFDNSQIDSPTFWYRVTTGRGTAFSASAAEYGDPR